MRKESLKNIFYLLLKDILFQMLMCWCCILIFSKHIVTNVATYNIKSQTLKKKFHSKFYFNSGIGTR